MSIKKLFGFDDQKRNYLSQTNDKDAYEAVESQRNVTAIREKQQTFVPNVDYAEPDNFAKYGSAYLYYKSSMERMIDYYPYDGSDAEQNEFYNQSLDIDKYIFNNFYPRTNGYIRLASEGWGSQTSITDGYGLPATLEYITFKGGPGTGSLGTNSLVSLSPNSYNDVFQNANIYDENIYQTAGLPSTWGSGSRESNLKADFDNGVTVEFWLTTGSLNTETTTQVLFDWWNNEDTSSLDYGRILIELTASAVDDPSEGLRPFLVTVQSGAHTTKNFISLGASSLEPSFASWNHYAIRLYNSSSAFQTELYVNGKIDDRVAMADYTLLSSNTARCWPSAAEPTYNSTATLQGWWRLNIDLTAGASVTDSSTHGRNGDFAAVSDYPSAYSTTVYPSAYIQESSNTFDGTDSKIRIGDTWNSIIGSSGTSKMSFSIWARSTSLARKRLIQFGNNNRINITTAGRASYTTTWDGATETWQTDAGVITVDTWHHIVVTYDASSDSNEPSIYVDGILQSGNHANRNLEWPRLR